MLPSLLYLILLHFFTILANIFISPFPPLSTNFSIPINLSISLFESVFDSSCHLFFMFSYFSFDDFIGLLEHFVYPLIQFLFSPALAVLFALLNCLGNFYILYYPIINVILIDSDCSPDLSLLDTTLLLNLHFIIFSALNFKIVFNCIMPTCCSSSFIFIDLLLKRVLWFAKAWFVVLNS